LKAVKEDSSTSVQGQTRKSKPVEAISGLQSKPDVAAVMMLVRLVPGAELASHRVNLNPIKTKYGVSHHHAISQHQSSETSCSLLTHNSAKARTVADMIRARG